ncbi:hypothetical protein BDV96DRAFT_607804 [Lophiotrema nucula]|uniref:Tat pathway signal sequence n=1 Tax=Lophiotrema nucula TaxID=690887 RepID=A0A6A5YGE4_9PLEO|nr:hypothetical protein BDV96DRAFT_607804 [Lophiotrema nucula]
MGFDALNKSSNGLATENLDENESASLLSDKDYGPAKRKRTRHLFKTVVLIALAYICFLETNIRLAVQHEKYVHFLAKCRTRISADSAPAPANEAVQYAPKRIWQDGDYSPYHKEPGPEIDALWNDLLTGQIVRVSPEEMKLQSENLTNRVQLDDGDYLGTMSVWHSLHCLDRLRKVIHMDYYHSRIPEYNFNTGMWTKAHSDHCIERLRDDIMCHPNVAIYIPVWDESGLFPDGMRMITNGETKCVNWDALDQWARKRALSAGGYTLKSNPFGRSRNGKE